MKPRNLIIALVAGVALAVGAWLALTTLSRSAVPLQATRLPSPAELPAFALVDHNGNQVDETVFDGHWNLVFFGFTHCPDICPITLQLLGNAKRELEAAGHEPLPRIVLVSVDPERDKPANLAEYIAAFGEGNLGLTGDLAELKKLTSVLGVFFEKRDTGDDYYAVDHSSVVIVIDPEGRYHAVFSSPHTVENFVHDVPLLMKW